jgi:hypothetical protein
MAILRGLDGIFYEIPDEQVARFKIPEEKLKEKLGAEASTEGGPPPGGATESGGTGPLVNVQIYYSGPGSSGGAPAEAAVQPYNWGNWRNWRNWHNWNNWRNHW